MKHDRIALALAGTILLAAAAGAWAGPPIPGDANHDGFVDDVDYGIWLDNYEPGVGGKTWEQADFTGEGIVDGADYTIWADNYLKIPFRGDIQITNNTGQTKTNWPIFLTVWKVFGAALDITQLNAGGFHVYDTTGTEIPHMVRQVPPYFSPGNDEIVFIVPAILAGQSLGFIVTNTSAPGLTAVIDLVNNPNNMLPNGGFETDSGGVPTGYVLTSGSAGNISYDTIIKRSGARSMLLTYPVGTTLKLRTSSLISLTSGRHYHFSLWARTENVAYNGWGFWNCGFWMNFDRFYVEVSPGEWEWRYPFTGRTDVTLRDNREWFSYRFDCGDSDGWGVPSMGPQSQLTKQSYFYLNGYQQNQAFLQGSKTGKVWLDEALLFEQPAIAVDRQTPLRHLAKNHVVVFARPVNAPRYKAFGGEVVKELRAFAMQGERTRLRFGVHALNTVHDLAVYVAELNGPGGTLSADKLDLEKLGYFITNYATILELAAGNTAEYLLSIDVPAGLQAGQYTGVVVLTADGHFLQVLRLKLEVLPVEVPSMAGYWVGGIYNVGYALARDDDFYRCYGKARFNYIMLFDYFSTHMGSLDVDLPYAQQQVDKLAALAHVTGGIGLYREPNMSEDQPRMWYQMATGDPTYPGSYPNYPNTNTFPQYKPGYQALATQLETHAQANDWPTMIYMVSDEPDRALDVDASMGWLNEALPAALTTCDAQYHDMVATWGWYNLPALDDPANWTGPLMYDYVMAHEGRFGFCGTAWGLASGRYQPGMMIASSGACYWHWWHTSGPFDYLESNVVRMHHIAAMGAGVNDLRYYLTLKEKIAGSSNPTLAAEAQAYLDGVFSFCTADHDRHLLPYNGVPTDWGYHRFYDEWRATMKDYILLLNE